MLFSLGTFKSLAGWQWIDTDNDGLEECYYFLEDGSYLKGTATPDGYIVTPEGKWTKNGHVQTRKSGEEYKGDTAGFSSEGIHGTYRFTKVSNLGIEKDNDFSGTSMEGSFLVDVFGGNLSILKGRIFSAIHSDTESWISGSDELFFDENKRLHWRKRNLGDFVEMIAEPIE